MAVSFYEVKNAVYSQPERNNIISCIFVDL
jgi:hypothetical protein